MKTISNELLEEMTRRLVAEFQPEQVILFGSHAWGTPNEDSDVDVLVIVSHSDEKPIQRAIRGHRCLSGLNVPKDILVKTRAEIERYRHVRASLENKILKHGKVLLWKEQTENGNSVYDRSAKPSYPQEGSYRSYNS